MKTIENHFTDWEQNYFGYGYGSGEEFVTPAIKKFLSACPEEGNYNYQEIEKALEGPITWLLMNTLCRADILEYGTSPRYGWLTQEGVALKKFMESKTDEELIGLSGHQDEGYAACFPDYCNCDDPKTCHNPFWEEAKERNKR